MVNGMADGEPRESGGEGIGVCPNFVPWVLTPVMGEFGVMVEGGCHFFFSDQGPLLKGSGGDVGGKYPGERDISFLPCMLGLSATMSAEGKLRPSFQMAGQLFLKMQ